MNVFIRFLLFGAFAGVMFFTISSCAYLSNQRLGNDAAKAKSEKTLAKKANNEAESIEEDLAKKIAENTDDKLDKLEVDSNDKVSDDARVKNSGKGRRSLLDILGLGKGKSEKKLKEKTVIDEKVEPVKLIKKAKETTTKNLQKAKTQRSTRAKSLSYKTGIKRVNDRSGASSASNEVYQNYQVQAGDSLWTISQKSGTSIKRIMDANGLKSYVIRPAQILRIPSGSSTARVAKVKPSTSVSQPASLAASLRNAEASSQVNQQVSEMRDSASQALDLQENEVGEVTPLPNDGIEDETVKVKPLDIDDETLPLPPLPDIDLD